MRDWTLSINCKQLKLLIATFLSLFIVVFSVSSKASESNSNTNALQKSSVSITESELTDIKATLSKQEKAIQLLIEKQQSNEEKSLEPVTSEVIPPKKETRLENRLKSIESSLNSMNNKNKYFSYADWAAIAITCVAVLLTIIGLAIAVLAFWGFGEIKELTKTSAATEAESVARQTMEVMINGVAKSELEKLINDGKLQDTLQAAVDMILRNDPNNVEKKRTEELLHELDIDESEFDGTKNDKDIDGNKI